MTTTKTMTLDAFLAEHAICRVWYVSVGNPTGVEFVLNIDDDADDEDYCDSQCLLENTPVYSAGDLDGTVSQDKDGEYRWDVDSLQDSDLNDPCGSTVLNLVVWGEL